MARVRLGTVNLMALDVTGVVTTRLDDLQAPGARLGEEEEAGDGESEDDALAAGPLSIAMDVNDPAADDSGASAG